MTTGENVAHKNKDLAKTVQNLWMEVVAVREVELCWVQGHTGDLGNDARFNFGMIPETSFRKYQAVVSFEELADKLANEGVKGRN